MESLKNKMEREHKCDFNELMTMEGYPIANRCDCMRVEYEVQEYGCFIKHYYKHEEEFKKAVNKFRRSK
jgi:hypothetical protein